MSNLRYKFIQFMSGRNGIDPLGYATIVLYFVVSVINSIVNTIILTIIGFLITILIFYRFLSKDITNRRSENERFMPLFNKVKSFTKQTVRRMKDFKTHRYRTCPGCKVTLKLPIKRGKHGVVCPRCKREFQVRVWI